MEAPEENPDGLQDLSGILDAADRPARERGLAQKYSNQGKITTLMLRNIPSKYTQDMLLEELIDCMGSSDSFDFFYLPWDQQNDCNIGYAFVNFRSASAAERCSRIFTNFSFRRFDSPKVCRVYPAHIQGLENNVLHLMDRAVAEARSHYPIIMWKGEKLKLGKVISALDVQRATAPASAPGKFMGSREPLNTGSGRDMIWPPPEGLEQLGTAVDPEDDFAGEGGGDDVDTGASGSLEVHLASYMRGARTGRVRAPRSHMVEGGHSESADWRLGRRPPGMLDGGPRVTPELEVLEAMPGLRLALQQQRKNALPGAGDMRGQGGLAAPFTSPMLTGGGSGPGGLQPCPEAFGMASVARPPVASMAPPGHLVPPGSWGSPLSADGRPQGLLPAGALPPGPVQPGLLLPSGGFAPKPEQRPLQGSVLEGCGAAAACGMPGYEAGLSSGQAMGADDPTKVRLIELRNPDHDVLSKFLGRFGS
mmetsp:Transcript_76385/g.210955  ORF Transcript_76385/g.210955 Transcript_76385/m.210955 type:complete len:478 (-) Transcript_76385:160-1593(-)